MVPDPSVLGKMNVVDDQLEVVGNLIFGGRFTWYDIERVGPPPLTPFGLRCQAPP
jgi:hypothetical protein